ncbi:MAG: flagellar motor switch protein FliN [Candidatus Marinimicrobia bacterium]|nr:flagellar motor switch protein FliN [Candidatus Neomarinimicrobiota bacterium]
MNDTTDNNEDVGDDWAAAMNEQADSEGADAATDEAPRADFQSLEEDARLPSAMEENIEMILDIPVTVSVEIGRSKINIRNLLKLNQGSVVELDRLAGEPMDVIVNGTLIAHGEVVVVNEKFGVRLTDVISAAERIKKLK